MKGITEHLVPFGLVSIDEVWEGPRHSSDPVSFTLCVEGVTPAMDHLIHFTSILVG